MITRKVSVCTHTCDMIKKVIMIVTLIGHTGQVSLHVYVDYTAHQGQNPHTHMRVATRACRRRMRCHCRRLCVEALSRDAMRPTLPTLCLCQPTGDTSLLCQSTCLTACSHPRDSIG